MVEVEELKRLEEQRRRQCERCWLEALHSVCCGMSHQAKQRTDRTQPQHVQTHQSVTTLRRYLAAAAAAAAAAVSGTQLLSVGVLGG